MLNKKDSALLTSKLYVPMVVRDMLEATEPMADDEQYALHETISNLQPDSALLSIALAAKEISKAAAYPSATLKVLGIECDRIIEDYAPLWLENAREKRIDEALVFDTLAGIPEDLEGLCDLLEVNTAFFASHDPKAAALCEILCIQAGAHALIAEEFVGVIDNEAGEPVDFGVVAGTQTTEMTDNVIPFPFGGKS